jgi:choline dehydrogenase
MDPAEFSDDEELLLEDHRFHSGHKADHSKIPQNKRWSVLEKLEKHYGDGHDAGKPRNVSTKCLFATLMLTAFVVCCWLMMRTLIFNIQLNPDLYDFIVVGGGPAGTVLARRLLDDGAYVLLLEAGDQTQLIIDGERQETNTNDAAPGASISEYDIPLLWPSAAQAAERHWGKFNALGINQFKGLGGGAMHSAMLYVRALSTDVLNWGVPSWDWDVVQRAYNSLEKYQIVDDSTDAHSNSGAKKTTSNAARGATGKLPTLNPGCVDQLGRSFVASAVALGEKDVGGFNTPDTRTGAGCYEVNIESGARVSPTSKLLLSYLRPNGKAPKLTLRTRATVRKVILSQESSSYPLTVGIIARTQQGRTQPAPASYRAIGVEYEVDGELRYAYLSNGPSRNSRNRPAARNFESLRCVALAAGALLTPKLLLSSGVGPVEEVRMAGVEARVDSPRVGKGLKDHIAVGMVFQAAESVMSGTRLHSMWWF